LTRVREQIVRFVRENHHQSCMSARQGGLRNRLIFPGPDTHGLTKKKNPSLRHPSVTMMGVTPHIKGPKKNFPPDLNRERTTPNQQQETRSGLEKHPSSEVWANDVGYYPQEKKKEKG